MSFTRMLHANISFKYFIAQHYFLNTSVKLILYKDHFVMISNNEECWFYEIVWQK